MGHLTDRANKFAEKYSKAPPVDDRSNDEKMAEFAKTYSPIDAIKKARLNAKRRNDAK